MSDAVRFKAIMAMWSSISVSWLMVTFMAGTAPVFLFGMLLGGLVGTVFIWKFRRPNKSR